MTQINENVEKTLAIMQEEGEKYLIIYGNSADEDRIWDTDKTIEQLEDEWHQYSNSEEQDSELTFNEWLNENYVELDVEEYDRDNNDNWLVCTDSEADEEWDRDLDNYIDECVLPEIPESYRGYFDDEKFKRDCKYDGRGHSLSKWDGVERYQEVNGTTYYLYKQ